MAWKLAQASGCISLRGVGLSEMHIIEKHFALANVAFDRREDSKIRRDEIISSGMLANPEVTKQYLNHLELEEELTEEDKKQIEEQKIRKMTDADAVKSDPVVQKMIRSKNEIIGQQSAIESLTDMVSEDG